MTGAVNVGVMAVVGVVFDVCGGDRDASLSLFGCLVDGTILEILRVTLFGLPLRDRCCESGLAVIYVANCACMSSEVAQEASGCGVDIPMFT